MTLVVNTSCRRLPLTLLRWHSSRKCHICSGEKTFLLWERKKKEILEIPLLKTGWKDSILRDPSVFVLCPLFSEKRSFKPPQKFSLLWLKLCSHRSKCFLFTKCYLDPHHSHYLGSCLECNRSGLMLGCPALKIITMTQQTSVIF